MNIPAELKKLLISELVFVKDRITNESDPKRKTYFLSAAHGAIERIMRYTTDGELFLAHFTLNICYGSINGLQQRISSGDTAVLPPADLWEQMSDYLDSLIQCIENDEKCYPVLEKIALLTYSLTGPGYYSMSYQKAQTK